MLTRARRFPHLRSFGAWRQEDLVSLDRCTLSWHWTHAGSHLIYAASGGAEADFPNHEVAHTRRLFHRQIRALFLHSSFAQRFDQGFSDVLASFPFINAEQIF